MRWDEKQVSVSNKLMIKDCHAVPYFGQSKEDTEKGHMWNRQVLIEAGLIYKEK